MLGWEFPPFNSGGLGVASKGMAEALSLHEEIKLTFALPYFVGRKIDAAKEKPQNSFDLAYSELGHFEIKQIKTTIASPYATPQQYTESYNQFIASGGSGSDIYGKNLFTEIERYKHEAYKCIKEGDYDLIHTHDWMTFPAAVYAKEKTGLPCIAHVHSTEMDRTGGNPNQEIFEIEKSSLEKVDKIIAVSNYTKQILVLHYDLPEEKIEVVHNGIDHLSDIQKPPRRFSHDKKTVLFLGRLTIQKGPDWFLKIAQKILEKRKDVQFLIAGKGDMLPHIIEEIARKNLQDHVFCLGFLKKEDAEEAFGMANVFVMPSVSEPFGLVAVEAIQKGTPVILSKQSGAREVVKNSFQADFWDTTKMADQILAVLEYPALHKTISENAEQEIKHLTWGKQSNYIIDIYKQTLNQN